MTMATTTMSTAATMAGGRSGRSLEELVDRIFEALFRQEPGAAATETTTPHSIARSVHDARRLRQAGDLDGALALLDGIDTAAAEPHQVRWAYAEWLGIARRRFSGSGAFVYSPATGCAAVVSPRGNGSTLEVLTVLGMRWSPGKTVSRRSLRGLRPLAGGAS